MGLAIEKTTNFGTSVNYWCLWRFSNLSFKDKICEVHLFGFPSKDIRDENVLPMQIIYFKWVGADFDFTKDTDIEAQVYEKIKSENEWSTALDVLD